MRAELSVVQSKSNINQCTLKKTYFNDQKSTHNSTLVDSVNTIV